MTMKYPILLAAAAAAIAVPATGAGASSGVAPARGAFQGTTAQGQPISFSVVSGGTRLSSKSTTIRFSCADHSTGAYTMTRNDATVLIGGGRFNSSWTGTTRGGIRYTVRFAGSFTASKHAVGTIQFSTSFPGSGTCSSGRVAWSARHR